MTTTDQAAVARAIAGECAHAYQEVFAERLVAIYLLGSLAYGGYSPAASDIDLAVILTDSRDGDADTVETTNETLRAKSDLHRKLSIFWSSLPALRDGRADGRFPGLDRLQLTDHGVLLLGDDVAEQVARPAADELRLESARFAVDILSTDEVVSEFRQPRRMLVDPVWFTKAVLFPVRFLYTSTKTTGRAANNDEAVDWYVTQPQHTATSLVRLAASVRAGLPLDPAQITSLLAEGLLPLYRHYIDDQTTRLLDADAPADLVTAFKDWRQRLE